MFAAVLYRMLGWVRNCVLDCVLNCVFIRMLLASVLFAVAALPTLAAVTDHSEFDATLQVPYRPQAGHPARTIALQFTYPMAPPQQAVIWQLDLLDADQMPLRRWSGRDRMQQAALDIAVYWDGGAGRGVVPAGLYQWRLRARAPAPALSTTVATIDNVLDSQAGDYIEQRWEMMVGQRMVGQRAPPALSQALALESTVVPYTVHYANLHSQTNHSDGGGKLDDCHGAQEPLSAPFGPLDAFDYARQHGLDILMASEHNHMYDGSDGTNSSADPLSAKARYQDGLAIARDFNTAHPGFVALYGMEWGVISKGGHLNIFNSDQLLGWEVNGNGQLLADILTPKGDYAALYTLMAQRGWIGQFNHPAVNGQFMAGGMPFGYSADGDQAMVLCEVMNTSAFSTNTTETETHRSNYEAACDKALEAGFHVAFSSNQDNHCANWGASYSNRSAILIPKGTPLTQASLLDALKARRVFATMDKQSQLILRGNGHLMGERFDNSGPLTLSVAFGNRSGRKLDAVTIFHGVPRRNGSVTPLSNAASVTLIPSGGEHFYYARVTQDDGKVLWSAPLWVTQNDAAVPPSAPDAALTTGAAIKGTDEN